MRLHKEFDSIESLSEALLSWDVDMHPLSPVCSQTAAGEVIQLGNEEYLYGYAGFARSLKMSGTAPAGMITFNLMELAPEPYWWRGNILDSEQIWVFPQGGELQSIAPPGFKVHTLSVTEEKVASVAAEFGFDLPQASKRPEVYRVSSKTMSIIRSKMHQARYTAGFSLNEMAEHILPLLVSGWLAPGASPRRQRPSARARDRAIRAALEIIDSYEPGSLSTASFLAQSCVSERTLQYAFLEFFGSSPVAVIKSLRLASARAELRKAMWGQKTVADIALEAGFRHMPQFATDYRRAFGELPSMTLRHQF